MRSSLRSPWVAAAVVTAVIVIFSILVVVFDDVLTAKGNNLEPLSPSSAEVAVNIAAVAVLYLVVWLVIAVAGRYRARRR